jgi:anti-sigma B factor antagonist
MDEMTDSAEPRFELSTIEPDTSVVAVYGEVDQSNAHLLRESLASALQSGKTRLVINGAGIRFLDSSGIAALLEARGRVASLVIVDAPHAVRRLIDVTGLGEVMVVEP